MKLTEKKAIDISIELWTWLAETGEEYKSAWDGWKKCGFMDNDCALCVYGKQQEGKGWGACKYCPYYKKFGGCCEDDTPFDGWFDAKTATTRKKYATQFLEQLKELEQNK